MAVTVIAHPDNDPGELGMSWEIVTMTATEIKLQLTFDDPLFVSFSKPDTLQVTFYDPDLFITTEGIQILPEDRRIRRPLPSMIPLDKVAVQESINGAASNTKHAINFML